MGGVQDTVSDPTTEVIATGVERLREAPYDSLVAIGGGSPIDTAKGMSVLHANGGEMRDYKVPNDIPKIGLPIIAIPTTAGTGSEVTRFTVITDTETDEKMLIAGLACCPTAAIVDYELTLTMPLRLTADTGIDSLTHAIEAYVSKRANPYTDGLAKNAMGLIAKNIRTACADPENRAAREAMMLGATTAGMAFSNASVALVHGMSRPIGAFFHVPHGLSNAMLLPEITAFSAPAALDRYADCARAMGVAEEGEGSQAAVARLLDALRSLNDDLKVPSPKAYGIAKAATTSCCRRWRARRSPPARRPTTRACRRARDHRAVPAGLWVGGLPSPASLGSAPSPARGRGKGPIAFAMGRVRVSPASPGFRRLRRGPDRS
jgi:alcohol dehydrogenase class IV